MARAERIGLADGRDARGDARSHGSIDHQATASQVDRPGIARAEGIGRDGGGPGDENLVRDIDHDAPPVTARPRLAGGGDAGDVLGRVRAIQQQVVGAHLDGPRIPDGTGVGGDISAAKNLDITADLQIDAPAPTTRGRFARGCEAGERLSLRLAIDQQAARLHEDDPGIAGALGGDGNGSAPEEADLPGHLHLDTTAITRGAGAGGRGDSRECGRKIFAVDGQGAGFELDGTGVPGGESIRGDLRAILDGEQAVDFDEKRASITARGLNAPKAVGADAGEKIGGAEAVQGHGSRMDGQITRAPG